MGRIEHVAADEGETGVLPRAGQERLLARGKVVVPRNRVPLGEQAVHEGAADETRAACD
jgi:hypothetical protein